MNEPARLSDTELAEIRARDKYADVYWQEAGRPMDGPSSDRRALLAEVDALREELKLANQTAKYESDVAEQAVNEMKKLKELLEGTNG